MDLSPGAVAKAAGVPRTRIERIVREEIGVTADTALRLSALFKTTPAFWLNLQADYDLQVARIEIAETLDKIEPIVAKAA